MRSEKVDSQCDKIGLSKYWGYGWDRFSWTGVYVMQTFGHLSGLDYKCKQNK